MKTKALLCVSLMILTTALNVVEAQGQELPVSDVQNSGCLWMSRGYEDEGEPIEDWQEPIPTIILTKEGTILSVEVQNIISNCATSDFEIKSSISDGIDGSPCSLSINVAPVLPEEITNCECPYNVSFTIRDFEPNSFYLNCEWFKGKVSLTDGTPLVLDKQKNDYRPLVEEGKHWTYDDFMPLRPAEYDHYYYYDLKGDTLIAGQQCLKMYCTNRINDNAIYYEGALYEVDKKVYCFFPRKNKAELLYDFDCTVGDTVHVYSGKMVVKDIQMEDNGGIAIKKYIFRSVSDYFEDDTEFFWVEGVGAYVDFFAVIGATGNYGQLTACELNGEKLYQAVEPELTDKGYHKMGIEGKRWNYIHYYLEDNGWHEAPYSYVVKGDTVIRRTTYKKLYYQDENTERFECLLFETGRTVYKNTDLGNNSYDSPILKTFFDFGREDFGRVFTWKADMEAGNTNWMVYGVDTIEVNNRRFRRYTCLQKYSEEGETLTTIDYDGEEVWRDIWVEGVGSATSGIEDQNPFHEPYVRRPGEYTAFVSCYEDGECIFTADDFNVQTADDNMAYHPFLKEGKTWNYLESYYSLWDDEQWTKDVSYVINGTTEIDGKTYYKMYRKSEDENKYYCALREEDRKVWQYNSDYGDQLLYDFSMSVGDSYIPSPLYNQFLYQLTSITPMRFHDDQLLNVLHYDILIQYDYTNPSGYFVSAPIVEGVGCEEGWNIMKLYAAEPDNGIFHGEDFLSCYEDDKCIFTADDFNDLNAVNNIAYRPFVEEGKVWKVGTISGNPVQVVDYYYFEGDTIVGGKTCKQMVCQRFVSPDFSDEYWTPTPSLTKVGAWYEEDKKVYFYDERKQAMVLKYDFSIGEYESLQLMDDYLPFVIGPRQTGGIDGFKGVYRNVMIDQKYNTAWLEGVGGIDGPTRNAYAEAADRMPEFLMSCAVDDEVIYLNDECEDGATPEGARKSRFDFTHTVKTKPKAPRNVVGHAIPADAPTRSLSQRDNDMPVVGHASQRDNDELGEEASGMVSLYGEYNALQLDINLDPLDDAYQVSIANQSGQAVYEKTVNAGNVVALSIDISTYAKGRYTVTVENSSESFTGQFVAQTTRMYLADVNSDGAVNVADISVVISVMANGVGTSDLNGDVNGDGVVDVADISAIISIMTGL